MKLQNVKVYFLCFLGVTLIKAVGITSELQAMNKKKREQVIEYDRNGDIQAFLLRGMHEDRMKIFQFFKNTNNSYCIDMSFKGSMTVLALYDFVTRILPYVKDENLTGKVDEQGNVVLVQYHFDKFNGDFDGTEAILFNALGMFLVFSYIHDFFASPI